MKQPSDSIGREQLLVLFENIAASDDDLRDWIGLLKMNEIESLALRPVPSSHMLRILRPRVEHAKRENLGLAAGLERAVASIENSLEQDFLGLLYTSERTSHTYMAWTRKDASSIVAYFVSRPEQRT